MPDFIFTLRILTAAVLLLAGSVTWAEEPENYTLQTFPKPEPRVARYASEPITVDGRLEEPVWKKAAVYSFSLGHDSIKKGAELEENGKVRLAWDKRFLYLAVDLEDADVQAEGTEDHEFHFLKGEVAELFLKHRDHPHYFELYVTPKGHKSCFYLTKSGGKLEIKRDMPLVVAAMVNGTLNDSSDRDRGWTAEMAVPAEVLTAGGPDFGPGSAWTMLVGRYNYSQRRGKDDPELTSSPKLLLTSFHFLQLYAPIAFEHGEENGEK